MRKYLMKANIIPNSVALFIGAPIIIFVLPLKLQMGNELIYMTLLIGSVIAIFMFVIFHFLTTKRLRHVYSVIEKEEHSLNISISEYRKILIDLLNLPVKSAIEIFIHLILLGICIIGMIFFVDGGGKYLIVGGINSVMLSILMAYLIYTLTEYFIHSAIVMILEKGITLDSMNIKEHVFVLSFKRRLGMFVVTIIVASIGVGQAFFVAPVFAMAIMFIVVGLSYYTIKVIMLSISTVYDKIDNIKDEKEIYPVSFDEIGEILTKLKNFIKNLFLLLKSVSMSADKVSDYSSNLAASSEEISASIEEISSTLQDVADATVQQTAKMNDLSKEAEKLEYLAGNIKSKVKMASGSANKTSESAEKGIHSITETVESMNNIYQSAMHSKEIVENLVERTEEIQGILTIITDIAEQTDLLALNAAIEAARVGEQGKGFAVVAEHIRKLAVESSTATDKISNMLENIRKEMYKARSAMDKQSEVVNVGQTKVSAVYKKLEEITQAVTLTVSMIKDIESSTDEQFKATQIIKSLITDSHSLSENIAANTQEISASIEEQMASIEELSSMAQDMNDESVSLMESLNILSKKEKKE